MVCILTLAISNIVWAVILACNGYVQRKRNEYIISELYKLQTEMHSWVNDNSMRDHQYHRYAEAFTNMECKLHIIEQNSINMSKSIDALKKEYNPLRSSLQSALEKSDKSGLDLQIQTNEIDNDIHKIKDYLVALEKRLDTFNTSQDTQDTIISNTQETLSDLLSQCIDINKTMDYNNELMEYVKKISNEIPTIIEQVLPSIKSMEDQISAISLELQISSGVTYWLKDIYHKDLEPLVNKPLKKKK